MTREEMLACLNDRPCNVCKFHTENGCTKWSCVFEGQPDDAENKGEWIPVSERLPKKSGKYWCTFGGTNLTGIDHYTTESDAKELFDDYSEEYAGWESQNVIAWMPLPESYKAEKGSEE